MPTNVDDIIWQLSPAQRKKVEARAAQLIAEEMTLHAAEDCRSHGRKPVACSGIPRPRAGCSIRHRRGRS